MDHIATMTFNEITRIAGDKVIRIAISDCDGRFHFSLSVDGDKFPIHTEIVPEQREGDATSMIDLLFAKRANKQATLQP